MFCISTDTGMKCSLHDERDTLTSDARRFFLYAYVFDCSLQVSSKELCRQLSKRKLVEKQLDKEVSTILQARVQTLQKVNDSEWGNV